MVDGQLVDEAPHLARLRALARELRIAPPMGEAALKIVMREVVRRNGVRDGIVYLQVTRGVAPRDHAFPQAAKPVLVVTARRAQPARSALWPRRHRRDHDPRHPLAALRHQVGGAAAQRAGQAAAREAGAYEAWQVDRDGHVTEGTSTNAWIVTADGEVVTRAGRQRDPERHHPARGPRHHRAARADRLVERPFTVAEAKAAREAFLTSTTVDLLPVVQIDGRRSATASPARSAESCARPISPTPPRQHESLRTAGVRAAGDPVRLGQHAGRHLGDDPRGAESAAWRRWAEPLWSLAETRAGCALSLRESFPLHVRRPLGGGARIYLDAFARSTSNG